MIISTNANRSSASASANDSGKVSEARAVRYTCDAWFPVNPDILKRVRKEIKDGTIQSSADLLLAVREDFALFGHVIKEVGTIKRVNKEPRDLLKSLREISLAELKLMIPIAESRVSNHRFAQLNELQKLRLQHFVISSTTVETLTKQANVDPLTALCGAFFRQLGYALVCWNYPRIYLKAMEVPYASMGACDAAFSAILGFSPFRLGVQLAAGWGAPARLLEVIEGLSESEFSQPDKPVRNANSPVAPEIELISRLCDVGEAFARAHDPKHFRCASDDLARVEQEVSRSLGPDAITRLKNQVRVKWASYMSLFKNIEAATEEVKKVTSVVDALSKNVFISACSVEAQRSLRDAYLSVIPGAPSPAAIKHLIEKSVLECGFERGCIYLSQGTDLRLIPSIVIGAGRDEGFVPVFVRSPGTMSDPIARARLTGVPMKGQAVRDGVHQVLYHACPLGGGTKCGVLYLETSNQAFLDGVRDSSQSFRALHQALCDALCLDPRLKAEG